MISSLVLSLILVGQTPPPDFSMLVPPPEPPKIKEDNTEERKPTARIGPVPDFSLEDVQAAPDKKVLDKPVREKDYSIANEIYVYIGRDKFGVKFRARSEEELDRILARENKKDWVMQDKYGRWIYNQDKATLEKDVSRINGNNRVESRVMVEQTPSAGYTSTGVPKYYSSGSWPSLRPPSRSDYSTSVPQYNSSGNKD